jgi:hypothetical protein
MRKPLVRQWTALEREILRQMAQAGKSKIAIASRLRRPVPSVAREARNMGFNLKANRNAFSAEDLQAQHRAFGLGPMEHQKRSRGSSDRAS